jgi:hypothetical protein
MISGLPMFIGDRECAFMRKRARSTTYPALAPKRLDWSRPKLVQTLIVAIGTSYVSRRAHCAQWLRHSRPAQARSGRTSAKRESIWMEHGGAAATSAMRECAMRTARAARIAWSKQRKKLRNLRDYMNVISALNVEQQKKLRNIRQTVRGSMRCAHVKTDMLKTRALYWQMLVYSYTPVIYLLLSLKEWLYLSIYLSKRLLLQHSTELRLLVCT